MPTERLMEISIKSMIFRFCTEFSSQQLENVGAKWCASCAKSSRLLLFNKKAPNEIVRGWG
jgi:hypothetical protein